MKIPPSMIGELWYYDESDKSYKPLINQSVGDVAQTSRSSQIPPEKKLELWYFDIADKSYKPLVTDGKIPISIDGIGTKVVQTIIERDALIASNGLKAFVIDATLDSTVKSGYAEYIYNINQWIKVSEGEGLDFNITATDVTETLDRVFVTPNQKTQIDLNTLEISNHSSRLTTLETNPVSTTDEKVKLNSSDSIAGYLEDKIDGTTIQSFNGKLVTKNLDGLTATITELNNLNGISGNVQAQINALTNIGNFTGSANTYLDINVINPTPQSNDMIIVIADETHSNVSTIYIYNGTSWIFSGTFTATVRDFSTNPLNLVTETMGVLTKTKYEKQNASDTSISDTANNFTSSDVEGALLELFTLSNSLKSGVANSIGSPLLPSDTSTQLLDKINTLKTNLALAITNKGVVTTYSNTLQEMTNNVSAIQTGSVTTSTKSTSKLNVVAPYTYSITLTSTILIDNLATSVLQFVGNDSGVVKYNADYNNGDETNFIYNANEVSFGGYMNIKDIWNNSITELEVGLYYETTDINFVEFIDYGGDLIVDTDLLNSFIYAIKATSSIVKASGDISLTGVKSLDSLSFLNVVSGNGLSKIAVSFDGGASYVAYNGTSWIGVNVNDKASFKLNGMSKSITDTLTSTEIEVARNNSNSVRFAYYLERPTYGDIAKNDKIQLLVTMTGYNAIAPMSSYNYSYDYITKTLTYNFSVSGTYQINYIDA